jgi:hypothetical protein
MVAFHNAICTRTKRSRADDRENHDPTFLQPGIDHMDFDFRGILIFRRHSLPNYLNHRLKGGHP